MFRAFIGLGSNLSNDPLTQSGSSRQILRDAIIALRHLAIDEVKVSSLYSSSPMGPQDQPDYVNAAVLFNTALSPHRLLDRLQQLEREAGRIRLRRWGERTLDLDILIMEQAASVSTQVGNSASASTHLFDMIELQDERLTLPHIGILDRAFVVQPLLELDPRLIINETHLSNCTVASTTDGIRIIADLGWEN
jgi:2-amino-4-hydroxy-6-hydroxymethyldihydropteridine diphosphokinase